MDTTVLRMEPELTIYGAATLRQQLADILAALAPGAALTLELDDVCEIDSAGMQVLIAAERAAEARGCCLRLRGHSPAVLDAFNLFGIATGECHDA